MDEYLIYLENLNKVVSLGLTKLAILKNINLRIKKGEFLAIVGASGSGKSTLLNIIGCLDKPTSGTYLLNNKTIDQLKDDELARIRNMEIGFVFQSFNLIPYYTALRNVEVPLTYGRTGNKKEIAKNLLVRLGLGERLNHKPNIMSGGEKQRVAIARALSTSPSLILADEPTGALDSKSGQEVLKIFEGLHAEGKTIIMVTHNQENAQYAKRTIVLKDGEIVDEYAGNFESSV